MRGLSGKRVIVTGGGSGIGRAVCERFGEEGAEIAIFDMSEDGAKETVRLITEAGGKAQAFKVDITDRAQVDKAVAEFEARGPVDVLVNNAGWDVIKPFLDTDQDLWKKVIDINLYGPLNMHHAVLPGMVKNGGGRVINIASDAGRVGEPHLAVYSGAKAGAAGFMRAIAKAGGRFGITANCVALGGTRTPAVADLIPDEATEKRALSQYVIRRLGEPEDPAGMILFLCSDAASWITGQTYPVNGGYSFAC